ncbi:MAG TPA: phosphoribosylglycinamide formyltransferase, partial [Planctomycetota bacterium]|nr:phosphoribosylglycinamide formyltransferase [Planctomycetota bacterium]
MSENEPARLGVLFSGGGRTLENLAQQVAQGSLRAQIAVAISSHPKAGGIARAQRFGIPTRVVDWREHKTDFSARVLAMLDEARVDWIVLAGFLRYLDFPGRWEGRVLNIHPSLLPRHGGKGFYGDRVHRAVLEAKDRVSGCTVHFVDREYDQGPIILQRAVAVAPDDTPESLAERV